MYEEYFLLIIILNKLIFYYIQSEIYNVGSPINNNEISLTLSIFFFYLNR